jgi:mannosyltransferase
MRRLTVLGAVSLAAVAVLLRFWTRSDMWLDEAQTLAIARLPLTHIPAALRQDGAPPLYYFLLHLWTQAFGTSDLAVRSLSGVLGVGAIPLTWLVGRRAGGTRAAWGGGVLMATSPFAIRYSTENRMYMLAIVLTLLGWLAVARALERPSLVRLGGVALVSAALLLTHYWCLYLVAGAVVMLAVMAARSAPGPGRAARVRTLVAVAAGGVPFLGWVPTFLFQLAHTGTPWSQPADFGDLGFTIPDWAGPGSNLGRVFGYLLLTLAVVGLFGQAVDDRRIELDLHVRPAARPVAFLLAVTLILALGVGQATGAAYSDRYTAVVLAFFLVLVALGLAAITDRRVSAGVLAAVIACGLAGGFPDVFTNRTQAGQAAGYLARHARPGDLVVYCPDQLGPAMDRLLPAGRYTQVPYPRRGNPAIVDWVDYAKVNAASHPAAFARDMVVRAGPQHAIWLLWSPDYNTLEAKCTTLYVYLTTLRRHNGTVFTENVRSFYEHFNLVELRP